MKYVIWAVIAALVGKAAWVRIDAWLATRTGTNQPEQAREESEISQLTDTLDWNAVTPGKALAAYVGPEWVNWIIWPIVAVLILLATQFLIGMIRNVLGKPVTSKSPSTLTAGTIFGWLAFGAIVIGALVVIGYFFGDDSRDRVVLPVVQVGETKITTRLHVAGTYQMGTPRIRPGAYHIGCARVVDPAWVESHPETPQWHLVNTTRQSSDWNDLRLTPEMQSFLTRSGVTHVRLELTRVMTPRESVIANVACPHLKWEADR